MPHKTGIEETIASFKKAGKNTIREKILYTYHQAQDINEKVAHILLCMVDEIEGKKPAPTEEETPTKEKETE